MYEIFCKTREIFESFDCYFVSSFGNILLMAPVYTSLDDKVTGLSRLGICTVRDLLYYIPFRYDDFSRVSKIASVKPQEIVTIRAKIISIQNSYTRSAMTLQKAVVEDETGKLNLLWFNQPFLTKALHVNTEYSFSGKIDEKNVLISPKYEAAGSLTHTGRLVPIYSQTEGVTSKRIRTLVKSALRIIIPDYLPGSVRFMRLGMALKQIHFPGNLNLATKARERLAFDELLKLQLETKKIRKVTSQKTVGHVLEVNRQNVAKFIKKLPFVLTNAQSKAVNEILTDMQKSVPMNRLLQGDVGCGKTVVAAIAMYVAAANKTQAVLMAPTEILALQHWETVSQLLAPFRIKVGLATGKIKNYSRYRVIVGTHALLSRRLNFGRLGLVVIDEQHRFGVEQRANLISKGVNPHVLTMTATPIPRTISLAIFGDLDTSIIDELPKNRLPVKTWLVSEEKRAACYSWIAKQEGQVFIICPVIEESEEIKAVTTEFQNIQDKFPGKQVNFVHGKLKNKDSVVSKFINGEIDILVTTPIVEVGLDAPRASIIVIENADRFGLAQLHQLRGRVGRRGQQGYCLLFGNSDRLKKLETIHKGMQLAELDLTLRGPGERYGTSQHGRWDLKIADFSDLKLLEKARQVADQFPDLLNSLSTFKILLAN